MVEIALLDSPYIHKTFILYNWAQKGTYEYFTPLLLFDLNFDR